MKRTSLKDIANAVNLSKTTISLILNGKAKENNISDETVNRVLAVSRKMNYSPNSLARSLSMGRSKTIGLIVPYITDSFFARVAQVIERQCSSKGYTLIYCSSEESAEKERSQINALLARQIDGLIIASSCRNGEDIALLKNNNFPLVLIDRYYPAIETSHVTVEDEPGAFRLVSYLIDRGHRRIAMVSVSSELLPIDNRQKGYRRALESAGIEYDERMIFEADNADHEGSVRRSIDAMLSMSEPPDAIFFANHLLAAVGFKVLKSREIAIPSRMAICCFGDSSYLELLEPSITAIPMPFEAIGNEALRILLDQIESPETSCYEQIVLPVTEIIRQST
ncbi:LacI family DNA-binding transcriptional regulator [Coprobacter tertius]|uniref:LacI family transcriptional regulator n=1 Tax=Coprobacter tertius TaxID=2944915 RepID=A0ABT1MEB2_9BACT|nr:LacI family DNA-binding transcriptional regulator [Coprobacter tertius]MCP9610709.1 LacI family transcriptional regulator [Coprobacter tertius]